MRRMVFARWLLSLLTTIIITLPGNGQDYTFSQFNELPMLRNPALAGVFNGDLRISGAWRNQWQSVTVPYQTGAMSAEVKFPMKDWNDWITVGLQATYDVAGDIKLKRTSILPVINYHKSISGNSDDYLSLAFMGGPVNSQFDPTKLKLDDQFQGGTYDPTTPTSQVFDRTGFNYWDASTGLTYSSGFAEKGRYYLGVGLFHLNRPKVAFYTQNSNVYLERKFGFNAGATIPTSDFNRVVLYGDYFMQGGNRQFLGGILYGNDLIQNYDDENVFSLYFGGYYRWNDALIPVIKMEMFDWSVGLSYDVNVSKLKTASNMKGGFELTATYKCKFTHRSEEANSVRCVWF
ncbi:type IX secretion system membrane protein, PorP/SprF family [Filimonas lacunae]|uniref:Type IX secretion system membrane protein, PorP/SprF family n=1 Tax=Filimonas lacunae TaxID=477680 RepID=A0A1N7M022_9BACT|nr:PorP/SprF family type IX secretion system membrane protein [Filimonas lacunae]SIS79417.1 type IX secretion system membrane protein, PorP/SprF family [Filimonas lacunae]